MHAKFHCESASLVVESFSRLGLRGITMCGKLAEQS
jgi:hypothetical protein